jgi:hypothetical protein
VRAAKWWIAGVGGVVAATAALTLWIVTSGDSPTEYATPEEAVLAACHADPSRPPQPLGDAIYPGAFIKEHGLDMSWVRPGDPETKWQIAVLQPTGNSNYRVVTCEATIDRLRFH